MRIDYSAAKGGVVKPVCLTPQREAELLSHLLLFYTGVDQSAEDILSEQTKGIKKNRDNLLTMLSLVDEAEKVLCEDQPLDAFGDLLHETWQMKRGLARGITNTAIDDAYAAGRNAGARGGKLLGAGGRGFLLLFADPGQHAPIRKALEKLMEVPFAFSSEGSSIIFRNAE
jgi:D-glycero-alpha-D-manno-heptose-7-phosphate kinase